MGGTKCLRLGTSELKYIKVHGGVLQGEDGDLWALETLWLNNNSIGDVGMQALMCALMRTS